MAWFNVSIFEVDKSGVAGVELATASEPPARTPRIWGRRPSGVDASRPLTRNLLLNLAAWIALRWRQVKREQRCAIRCVLSAGRLGRRKFGPLGLEFEGLGAVAQFLCLEIEVCGLTFEVGGFVSA